MHIVNTTRQQTLASAAWMARNPFTRFVGLLGKRSMPPGAALILHPCAGVHMFGMCFAIDALYLDHARRVVRTVPGLAPWRVGPLDPAAASVIELPAGTIAATATSVGDLIAFEA